METNTIEIGLVTALIEHQKDIKAAQLGLISGTPAGLR